MQKYVLTTADKLKYILNDQEYGAVTHAIMNNEKKIIVQGEIIPLHITPSVVTFERWYAQENQRLALTSHRLCNKCLSIMNMFDKCKCWETQGIKAKLNAFKSPELPTPVKALLAGKQFDWPALTEADRTEIESQKTAEEVEYAEENGMLGYRDQETGDILYA